MPATLHLESGETLNVKDSVAEARAKMAAKGMQPFVTTLGNQCRVKVAAVKKVTPLSA